MNNNEIIENEAAICEVISSMDVSELEQRYEYDTNISICHYEWHIN
ncbi:hypothetical protein [Rheinheimera sp. WS51]